MSPIINRRSLLTNAAALASLSAIGWHPKMARAARGERKVLFYFASGAWDTTQVFDPHHGSSKVSMDPETFTRDMGPLWHNAGEDRPAVSQFFNRWGNRTAIVNGIDAHTVGHDSGRMMTMTGTSATNYPDWPTAIAASGVGEYPLPHVVFGGPSYGGHLAGAVVRAGGGTLLELIDGSIVGAADAPAPSLSTPSDQMIDAFVFDRSARFASRRGGLQGLDRERTESLVDNLDRSMEIEGRKFEAGLGDLGNNMLDRSLKAVELMRLGLTRCAMIGIPGGWDSHGDNSVQAPQFDNFFADLDVLMDHMSVTPGTSTRWLIDEVVIVAMSEFGRTPLWNGSMGKDHWPYNSTMVIGSGVNGGRSLGATDDGLIGMKVDFSTGLASDTGDILGSENVGAAILQIAGVDPGAFLPGIQPFHALVRG